MKLIKSLKLAAVGIVGTALGACAVGDDGGDVGTRTQNLTSTQNRILSFESPTADWTTNNGSPTATSTEVTEGNAALAVTINGYTQISSTNLDAPGSARPQASFDIKFNQSLYWGDARLVMVVPSQGHYWRDLGGQNLAGMAPGQFHSLSFSIPQDVEAALSSSATDLSFRIILNAQSGTQFIVDNLVVSDSESTEPPESTTNAVEFGLAVPRGTPITDYVISATGKVTIDDRSTISKVGSLAGIANLGNGGIELGSAVQAYSNLVSVGDVEFLRSQAHLYGSVTTAGSVLNQDHTVVIDGPVTEGASVNPATTTWTVNWPSDVSQDISLPPDSPPVRLKPGAFDSVQVFSRSGIVLEAGKYFINSLVIEPQVEIIADVSKGPIEVYVRDTLLLRSPILYVGGKSGQLLFGYLGNQPALFEEALTASVVAPNSAIELRRPNSGNPHRGAFFGKEVHVFSDAVVLHEPLDWSFACASDDFDGDGVLDCFDECWRDPLKVEPGLCDCGTPDDDTDGDRVPDCMDECPLDANLSTRGMCHCPSEENALPAGAACNDGLVYGTFTCDESGQCGPTPDEIDDSIKPQPDCWLKTLGGRGFWICGDGDGGGGDGDGDGGDGDGDDGGSGGTTTGATAGSGDPQGAAALCAKTPGGRLVQIDTYAENALIASWVSGSRWIGAADFSSEGDWFWRGRNGSEKTQFWAEGASGRRVDGKYSAWAGDKPATDDDKNCATISADGLWRAEDCSQPRPYVCEFPFSNDAWVDAGIIFPTPKGIFEIIPGTLGDDVTELPEDYPVLEEEEPPCVEYADLGMTEQEYHELADAASKECEEHCGQDAELDEEDAADCEAEYCKGPMLPPQGEDCDPLPKALIELDFILPGTCEVIDFADLPENSTDEEKLAALREGQDCSGVELPNGTLPFNVDMDLRCGVQTVCLALDSNNRAQPCASPGDCATGVCSCPEGDACDQGVGKFCLDPNLANTNACQVSPTASSQYLTDGPSLDRVDSEGNCLGQCFSRVGCGTTEKEATLEFRRQFLPHLLPPPDPPRCDETRICGPTFDEEPVAVELEEKEAFEDTPLPQEPDVVPAYPSDFDDPCSSTGFPETCTDLCLTTGPGSEVSPECARTKLRHPWCTNDVVTPYPIPHHQNDTRSGGRGEGSAPVSFSVTPTSDMNFDLTPLPYGAAKFSALASAGVTATVHFDVLKTKGSVEIVDLKAQISASLCRASTAESKLEVVGVDFLPQIASAAIFDSDDYLPVNDAGQKWSEACEQAVTDYVDAFDRAKKALRDAQELISQYKDLEAQGLTFQEDFCETIAGKGMRPPGMEGICPEEPHEVINRFIAYYKRQATEGLRDAIQQLSARVLDGLDLREALAAAYGAESGVVPGGDEYNFFADLGIGNEESVTLVSLQFFIGPIPCLLEITSYVDYGIEGGFGLKLNPDVLLGRRGEFAQVGAEVGPYANSGITLFVGAGFNFGILKLAVGVEGGVTLGHVGLPAVVSAGLALQRSGEDEEERPLPPEVADLTNGQMLFPPRGGLNQYAYQFNYKYGIGFEVTDILTGYLDGTLKVKFAFFSKKFSKRIATFQSNQGIGPVMLISGDSQDGLGEEIGGGTHYKGEVAKGNPTWKQSFESVPFMELTPLDPPQIALTQTEPLDTEKVKDLFYDELCQDCAPSGEKCGRDADCCTQGDACLGAGEDKVCGPPACLPSGETCTFDSDCCGADSCLLQMDGTMACSVRECTLPDGATCQRSQQIPTASCCSPGAPFCIGADDSPTGTCKIVIK